jgi:hypothetical protein
MMVATNDYTYTGPRFATQDWQNPQQVPWHRWDAVPRADLVIDPTFLVSQPVTVGGAAAYSPGTIMGRRADGAFVPAVKGAIEPSAVLVDWTDATLGDVAAGIYVAGRFASQAVTVDPSFTLAEATEQLRSSCIYLLLPFSP